MTNFLKNAMIAVGVLVVSTAVFFLVRVDKELTEDVLGRSLRTLGNQLISLIPEAKGEEQETIATKWEEFARKAQRGDIDPERVEQVAVGILNARNLDEKFSVNDVEVMLNLALSEEQAYPVVRRSDRTAHSRSVEKASIKAHAVKSSTKQRLARLGEELSAVCGFNERIRESLHNDPGTRQIFVEHLRYNMDNGIKLSADIGLKKRLQDASWRQWTEEFDRLDKKELVEWRHNLAVELDQNRMKLKMQFDSLKVVMNADNFNFEWQEFKTDLKELEQLKSLEKLQHLQAVSPDYIEKVVTESLKNLEVKVKTH